MEASFLINVDMIRRHFALAVPLYTHFTSPIRRYADLVVHRLLAQSLNYEPREGVEHVSSAMRMLFVFSFLFCVFLSFKYFVSEISDWINVS